MARTQTLVQLSDDLIAALDQRAARRGVSRSQLIREAVAAYIADDLDAALSRRILAGYERIPQHTPDEWGDPEAFADASSRELHAALDDEERTAGSEPW